MKKNQYFNNKWKEKVVYNIARRFIQTLISK